jgi:PAS domain S-box-containing protein
MTEPALNHERSEEPKDLIRERTGDALRRQVGLLQDIFDSMLTGIFILDDETRNPTILECNRTASTIFGYEKKEIIERTTGFLYANDEAPVNFLSLLRKAADAGGFPLYLHASRMKRKDGSVFPADLSVAELLNDEKERVGWVSTVRDVTEHRKMEEKLSVLHRHAKELNAANSVDEIGNHTLAAIEYTLGFRYAEFEIVEEGAVHIKNARGLPSSLPPLPLNGPGVIVKAAKTKRTLRIPDTRKEPAFVDTGAVDKEGRPLVMLSELAVPVIVEGEAVAVINVESHLLDAFTEMDQILLETLAMHVSSAIERLKRMERLHQRAEELTALQATVLDITTQRDLPTMLQTIVKRATRLLSTSSGGMYLCDPKKKEVRCAVSYNTPTDYSGTVLRYGEGAAGVAARTGKPLIINDYSVWKGRASVFEKERPFGAVLAVPMIWHGQVTGVIDVLDDAKRRHFTQADLDLLMLFANQAAIAVENARLLNEEKEHAAELARYSSGLEQAVVERTKRLGESERRFRELTELLPQVVFETDIQGNLTYLNRAGFATAGYTEDDLRGGLNVFQMFVPDDRDRAIANARRILNGEKVNPSEYAIERKNGTILPVIVHSAPIMRENKAAGLRGIVVDISEHKRLQEELRKSQRLATIGELAAMVGHDLRNPLTAIVGVTYYLRKKLGPRIDKEAKSLLQVIDQSIEHSNKIITDLLEYSREIRLELTRTDAESLTRDALAHVKIPRKIRVVNLAKKAPRIEADPDQMRRVFLNLITNAVDAMPKGGTLTIKSMKSGNDVKITLADTGVGIRSEAMEKLWDPFFTTKSRNMGLGLSIVRRLVEAHGGRIWAESEGEGKGAMFAFTLPRRGPSDSAT